MKALSSRGLLFLSIVVSAAVANAQEARSYDDRPKISVNGEAVVSVHPNKIIIRLGVETSDKDILASKQKNNDIVKKALAIIKEAGVADKDVQTDHLSIEPRWTMERNERLFLGYFVRNTIAVTLDDVAKVEGLVTDLLQAGVNYIHGIEFQTTDFKTYREQARELALKAAREKAEKMAAVLGESVGRPVGITEGYGGSPCGYWSNWSGWGHGSSQGMAQTNVMVERGDSGENTETIALGKLSVRANVSVVFELVRPTATK